MGRASDSRSKDPRFEVHQKHKNKLSIKFAVKIVRLKVYLTIASPMTLTTISRLQVGLKLDYFLTCNISDNI